MAGMRAPFLCFYGLLLAVSATAQDRTTEALKPMAVRADPAFEVAAIKPADPNDRHRGF